MLYGIDVSSNQPADICSLVDYGFAIVKATGNPPGYAWNYKNPYMEQQVNDALDKTGCAGLYHFTFGRAAKEEADFFCDTVADYVGRVMLVIDYEGYATSNGREWLRTFAQRVKYRTGVNPVVYASSSIILEQDLESLAEEENLSLWSANYYLGYRTIYGYDASECKADIPSAAIWQFTSQGVLDGYDGYLDLNVFYGDADAWMRYCVPEGEEDMLTEHQDKLLATIYEQVTGTYDPTGRGIALCDHDHIKWIGKQTADNGAAIEDLKARMDSISDKLDELLVKG